MGMRLGQKSMLFAESARQSFYLVRSTRRESTIHDHTMDPALLKQKEAFKKRALEAAATTSQVRQKKDTQKKANVQSKPKKSSKTVRVQRPPPQLTTKLVGDAGSGLNNPYRLLKSVMDMLKERYASKNYESLTFEEIISKIGREDLSVDLSQWLEEALLSNPKVHFSADSRRYLFKPALGLGVRNRRQLLELLKEWEREGKGGMMMSDVREAVYNPERAIKKLDEDGLLLRVTRSDKEEVIFYNNPAYSLPSPLTEDLKALWHRISVDALTETDIERYLQRVGIGAMLGAASDRKRKAPSQQRQQRKRAKNVKMLNTHLDSELFSDESASKPN